MENFLIIFYEISHLVRPKRPELELLTKPNHDGHFNESSHFKARCIVRDARPAANITWLLDNEPIYRGLGHLDVQAQQNDLELSTTSQTIEWKLSADDNDRKLICRSHHQSDRDSVPPQEGIYPLSVRC